VETTGLDPSKDRLLTIGVKSQEEEIVLVPQDEKKLLQRFLAWLAETEAVVQEFSHSSFCDLRLQHQILRSAFPRKRCEVAGLKMTNGFCVDDLMIRLYPKGYPFCENFDKAAARFGIMRVNTLRGSDVPRLWAEGKVQDIVAHNLDDIRAEFELWKALQSKSG